MKRIKLKNLRVNGNRIPQEIWNRVAETLLPGPAPTPTEARHGKSKSAVLKRIAATDGETRRKALKLAGEYMSETAKQEATEAGWELNQDPEVDPAYRDRGMWDLYRMTAIYCLEKNGTDQFHPEDPNSPHTNRWTTPNGDIPCLSEAEVEHALKVHAARKGNYQLPSMISGGQIKLNGQSAGPEYIPSGVDWYALFEETERLDAERTAK